MSASITPDRWLCLHPTPSETDISKIGAFLDNRGLAYGDGFFTTMGVIDGQVLWPEYHHGRLVSHASALQLKLDSDSLIASLKTHAKQLSQGMLKLIVMRAVQDVRGYGYIPDIAGSACGVWLKPTVMNVATAISLPLSDGQFIPLQPIASAVCLSSQIACLPTPLAGLKSLNRLDNVLASGELHAIKAQALKSNVPSTLGEGLLRDMSGYWIEGTMSNVFYQLSGSCLAEPPLSKLNREFNAETYGTNYLTQGQWYTPSMAQSGVAGVMRQVIIDTLSTTESPVIIRPLRDDDFQNLSQMFFCNALRGMMPMDSLTLLSGEVVGF